MFKWNDGTELYHHGIKGQKWGVRRFQNEDGSLTAAGRERYGIEGKGENSTSSFDPSNARGKASKPHGYQAPAKQPYRPHSRKVYKQLGGALPFKKGEEVDIYGSLSGQWDRYDDAENYDELMDLEDFEEEYANDMDYVTPGQWAELKNRFGISKEEYEDIYRRYLYALRIENDLDKADKIAEEFTNLSNERVKKNVKSADAHTAKPWTANNKKKQKGVETKYEVK